MATQRTAHVATSVVSAHNSEGLARRVWSRCRNIYNGGVVAKIVRDVFVCRTNMQCWPVVNDQNQNQNVIRAIKNRQEVSLVYCMNQTNVKG